MIRNIQLRHGNTTVIHDDLADESTMRKTLNHFFDNKDRGTRETCSIYRGCIIVRQTVQFPGCRPDRRTVSYMYFPADGDQRAWVLCLGRSESIEGAKGKINVILDTGMIEPDSKGK